MDHKNVSTISPSRTLPLLANVIAMIGISAAMLWFAAETDYKVHALLESILTLVTMFVVGVSLYLNKREADRFFLIVGLAFAGNWILEVWHLLSSLEHAGIHLPHASEHYSSASWIAPRLYLAFGLLIALFYRSGSEPDSARTRSSDAIYYVIALIALVPTALASLKMSTISSTFPLESIQRPEEFAPAAVFAAAMVGYILKGRWRRSVFEYYLLCMLAISTLMHAVVMAFSTFEFDAFYAVSHFLKFSSYLIVIVGLILYGRDRSSDKLEDEKQLAETMLNIMDEGILVIDKHYIIKDINPAARAMLGQSQEEFVGAPLTQWFPGLQFNSAGEVADDSLSPQRELSGIRSDSSEFPAEVTFKLLPKRRSRKSREFVAVVRDISERKSREIERINFNRQFSTALKAAGLGKWEWNLSTQRMAWDDQCDNIYGLPQGSRGMELSEISTAIHPDDIEFMNSAFASITTEGKFRDAEFRIFRKNDQSERWITMSGTQLVGDEGKEDRIVGVLRDITAQKNSIDDLQAAREAADEASQVKSAFLANMSHEIRTPMNGVVGMLDVLQESRLNSKQTDMVNVIKESAFSLLHLIDDILDFSKIEAGKLDVEIAPMDVAAVSESVCASLNMLAQEKGVELALFTDPKLPSAVMGDTLRIRQVLVNLANNAIKFSKDNTRIGKVCMQTMLVDEDEHSATVEFRVDDNGIGMTQSVQDAVFGIFVQADSSTSRKFGGTGLGLTISKNLVEMMGGEIDLYSVPGEGSTFIVRVQLPKTTMENAPIAKDWKLQGVECLLLEEPGGYTEHLASYLQFAGLQVEQVAEVTEALQWLNATTKRKRVVVVDGGAAHLNAVERKLLERDNLGIVVIQRERGQLVNHIPSALCHSGNAMNRDHFLQLVAASAETVQLEQHSSNTPAEEARAGSPTAPSRKEAIAQNRLILVAEDNPTNQQVVLEQLTVLGYHADIADNGEQGLAMWREGCYALLLTDLQMPKMDGYELAASIRKEEVDHMRMPIVALSADALVGEAERSQKVGMDDYLAKPARMNDLKNMLEKWLEGAQENGRPAVSQPNVTLEELAILDVSVLEALVGTDEARINGLLQAYRESSLQISGEMIGAWKAANSDGVAAAAHQLKSASLSIGAMRVGHLSNEIEHTVKTTDSVPALELMQSFEHEHTAVEQAIADANAVDRQAN
ncbi:MAG: ATP-binding protein [Halioglobus sp.]